MQETSSSTSEKVQQAALDEFLDEESKGSPLRQIVKNAGVTTGASYGYSSSKEALSTSAVELHAKVLMSRPMDAQLPLTGLPKREKIEHVGVGSESYPRWTVDYICGHREPVKLLICGTAGTDYEDSVHNMVKAEVESTTQYAETLQALGYEGLELSRPLCHIIASGMLGGISEIVVHDVPKEGAKYDVEQLQEFYTVGRLKLFPI